MKRLLPAILIVTFFTSSCGLLSSGPRTPEPTGTLPGPSVRNTPAPDAEAAATQFLDAWKQSDYDSMYAMLSSLTQAGISKQAFVDRYDSVVTQAALSGIDTEIVSSLVHPDSAQVRYRVTFHSTVVGDFVVETYMDLTREDNQWKVAWSDSAIMPDLANGNQLSMQVNTPVRANIYDRNGLALATQGDIVALWIVPNQIGDGDAESNMLSALSRLLDRPADNIKALYDDIRSTDWRVNLGEVSLDEFQRYQGTLAATGGVQWAVYQGRYYPNDGLAPHSVGYVAQIQAEQVEQYQRLGYRKDAFVGQDGLEAVYESDLRGTPGGTLYVLDAGNNVLKELASRDPEPPYAVYTNLDRDLQLHTQQALASMPEQVRAAAVVLDRDSGAVLAIASSPGFDPNLFNAQNPNSSTGLTDLYQNPNQPFVNRATHGTYPVGSLFKIITMAAALKSGYYTPQTIYNCGNQWNEDPSIGPLNDWTYERGLPAQGEITLMQGLERSCNPWFFHIGYDLFNKGLPEALPDMAKAFGLGSATGIEIGDEAGLVPSPETKAQRNDLPWGIGDVVNLAIGQGFLQATPLQVARYVAAVGNGGTLFRPQLVQKVENAVGDVKSQFTPEVQGKLPLSNADLKAIEAAMVQVVRAPKGTARNRFLGLNLNIAGKTGTAQTAQEEPNAWFGAYTFEGREDKPDIAVAVIVENQGEGSDWAAPVVRRIIESYFFGRPLSLYPWESQIGVIRTATPTPDGGNSGGDSTPTP